MNELSIVIGFSRADAFQDPFEFIQAGIVDRYPPFTAGFVSDANFRAQVPGELVL